MTHPVTPTAAVSGSVSFQYRSNVSRFKAAVCMNVHWSLWRAVRRLKHPTCPVRNIYHRLPGPAHACPPPAGQAPQFPHPCCPPLLCPSARRRMPGPVAGRAQAETPHLPSTECLSKASRATASLSAAHRTGSTDYVSSAVRPCCEHECAPGPVAGRAQAETPHLPSTECLSQASRASASLSAVRRASTTVSAPLLSAPAVPQCAQAGARACGGPCAG